MGLRPRRFLMNIEPDMGDGDGLVTAELRRQEARFRSLVETSDDIVLLTRPTGEIEYISSAVTRILGHDPATLLGGTLIIAIGIRAVAGRVRSCSRRPQPSSPAMAMSSRATSKRSPWQIGRAHV